MKNSPLLWLVAASALALGACTQEPAQIVYKGDAFYGREHDDVVNSPNNETFDEDAPKYKLGYARPVQDAAVTSVGVSDLPPPTQGGSAIQSHDIAAANTTSNQSSLAPHFLNKNDGAAEGSSSVQVQDTPAPVAAAAPAAEGKFIWPVDGGKIISHFDGGVGGKGNDGINIGMAEGEPIFASASGNVVYAGNELQGYGNMVILRHADGWMSAYAHARSLAVKKGAKVKQGDVIAYVGSTGGVKTPQVHFVLRKDKTPVNPEKYLPRAG